MVEVEKIVSMYRSYKGDFSDEIESLNNELRKLEINCEVISQISDDGEKLIFKQVDL